MRTERDFAAAARLQLLTANEWKDGLRKFNNGNVIPQLANVIHALKNAPELAGVVAFDDFGLRVVTKRPAPWHSKPGEVWNDNDDRKLAEWCQHNGINIGMELAANAVQAVASENRFHPLRDWLTALEWDRVPRLDDFATSHLGADATPFHQTAASKFLISAVARVLSPGVKADAILVLEGPQGALKSSAARVLFQPHFTDHLPDLHSKDAFLQLAGAWGVEISELSALGRSSVERVKGFLSASVDRYRPPYGKRVIEVPRQCVFVGTTNADGYLMDETGGRRFWPIKVGRIDLKRLVRDRDQLFAEAVVRFRADEPWWLTDTTINRAADDAQRERFAADAWHEVVGDWLADPEQRRDETGHPVTPYSSSKDSVSVPDVLVHAVGKRIDAWTQADANRVARTLRALGWERVRRRENGALVWRYVPTVPTTEACQ
ncbi:MAG: virulence-associated E family protein [Acidobacteriota bacterium]